MYGVDGHVVCKLALSEFAVNRKMEETISSREKRPKEAKAAAAAFGVRLKAARGQQGLTLREVSERSKLSIAYLSDLERGVLQNPTLNALQAIGRALRTPLNDLLGVEEEHQPRTLPEPLRIFASWDVFREAVDAEARRRRAEPEVVRDSWLAALARIEVDGRRPREPSDYLLIFEALRRALSG
jgi:transcriptional regulator with XRE-family HTH domain